VLWAENNLDVIVAEARRRGAPATDGDLRRYFAEHLGYRVGVREGEGLRLYLAEGGLLPSGIYGKVSA